MYFGVFFDMRYQVRRCQYRVSAVGFYWQWASGSRPGGGVAVEGVGEVGEVGDLGGV